MRVKDNMGISRKREATTARQANLPENLNKSHQFWTTPFLYDILGVYLYEIIDFDQAANFLETTNRGYGKCSIGEDLNEEGPYNHNQKYTLALVIGSNPQTDR